MIVVRKSGDVTQSIGECSETVSLIVAEGDSAGSGGIGSFGGADQAMVGVVREEVGTSDRVDMFDEPATLIVVVAVLRAIASLAYGNAPGVVVITGLALAVGVAVPRTETGDVAEAPVGTCRRDLTGNLTKSVIEVVDNGVAFGVGLADDNIVIVVVGTPGMAGSVGEAGESTAIVVGVGDGASGTVADSGNTSLLPEKGEGATEVVGDGGEIT